MKTISVYDAVKLATKGPLSWGYSGVVMTNEYIQPLEIHQYGEPNLVAGVFGDVHGGERTAKVNATLLAHFFNHGPALLAMLEEFVKLHEPFRKQLDANETEILDESIALIAKASKVEIEE